MTGKCIHYVGRTEILDAPYVECSAFDKCVPEEDCNDCCCEFSDKDEEGDNDA